MQYKIPVQIENEDPIILGLSLRQMIIVLAGGGIGYAIFNALVPVVWVEIAAIPWVLLLVLALLIAKFYQYGMTFTQFVFAFLRSKANLSDRKWVQGIDSFQPIDIGFISQEEEKPKTKVDFSDKASKIQELEEKLNKI